MTNVGRRSCPPVSITWCTFWPCSGRSSLPSSPLQNTGMAGPVSSSPSSWLACWQLSSETWLPTLDAPLAWKIPWLQWCLLHLELRCQVGTHSYIILPEADAHFPSCPFVSYSFESFYNELELWRERVHKNNVTCRTLSWHFLRSESWSAAWCWQENIPEGMHAEGRRVQWINFHISYLLQWALSKPYPSWRTHFCLKYTGQSLQDFVKPVLICVTEVKCFLEVWPTN